MMLALASLTRMRGRPRSSRNRWLCSIKRRSFSSDMDGFGRDEEDMDVGRWGEGGYTELKRLLCAATLLLGALWVREEKRVRISGGLHTLKDERRVGVLIRRRGCDAQAIGGWLGGVKRMGGK